MENVCRSIAAIVLVLLTAPSLAEQHQTEGQYTREVIGKIRRHLAEPCESYPRAARFTVFDVELFDDGYIRSMRLTQGSGYEAYDQAVLQAIRAAEPLPVPSDPAWRAQLKGLTLRFKAGKNAAPCRKAK